MARWNARGRLPISANWTFLLALTVEALWANIGRNCAVSKAGVSLWAQISGGRGSSSTNEYWRQKTRVPGLLRGVCVIRRLAVYNLTFSRFDTVPACGTQTDTQTHDDGYYPRSVCFIHTNERISTKLGHISSYDCYLKNLIQTLRTFTNHGLGAKNALTEHILQRNNRKESFQSAGTPLRAPKIWGTLV